MTGRDETSAGGTAEGGEETVRRIASLARLDVTDEEAARLAPGFARVLAAFAPLAELDLSVPPSTPPDGAGASAPSLPAATRADVARTSPDALELLAHAPARQDDFYRVPKTVDREG